MKREAGEGARGTRLELVERVLETEEAMEMTLVKCVPFLKGQEVH